MVAHFVIDIERKASDLQGLERETNVNMLVDYVSRKKRSRTLQRCNSTRDLLVASVFLQKRCANGADGARRISVRRGRFFIKSWDTGDMP